MTRVFIETEQDEDGFTCLVFTANRYETCLYITDAHAVATDAAADAERWCNNNDYSIQRWEESA